MKVYQNCPVELGRGIQRVREALITHAPGHVTFVMSPHDADFIIHHVVGVQNFSTQPIDEIVCEYPSKRYAMIQYCLRTTENPRASYWRPLWAGAELVWSYYDLNAFLGEDERYPLGNFYYAPLGVDTTVFRADPRAPKFFELGTSGYVAETECVQECYNVVRSRSAGATMLHLGPNLRLGPGVAYVLGVTDEQLARLWSECKWVSGLRRVEGFELPALEGLLCGARPILFDAPHYRNWFGDFADYIPEGPPEAVEAALRQLMMRGVRRVSETERVSAAQRFDWGPIVRGFWKQLR